MERQLGRQQRNQGGRSERAGGARTHDLARECMRVLARAGCCDKASRGSPSQVESGSKQAKRIETRDRQPDGAAGVQPSRTWQSSMMT
eukprot:6197810-Pleurochrysis_carterae.AAC.3